MKKLLVLALVLSVATLANAGLTPTTINGLTITPTAGGAITVVGTQTADFDLVVLSNAAISPLDATAFTTNAPGASAVLAGFSDLVAGDTVDDLSAYSAGAVYTLASFPGEVYKTGTYMNLTYTVAAGTIVDVAIFDEINNAFVQGSLTNIVTTPEPITMTLLGLGGLFLRRRSK